MESTMRSKARAVAAWVRVYTGLDSDALGHTHLRTNSWRRTGSGAKSSATHTVVPTGCAAVSCATSAPLRAYVSLVAVAAAAVRVTTWNAPLSSHRLDTASPRKPKLDT